jgi:hypothetical protein
MRNMTLKQNANLFDVVNNPQVVDFTITKSLETYNKTLEVFAGSRDLETIEVNDGTRNYILLQVTRDFVSNDLI